MEPGGCPGKEAAGRGGDAPASRPRWRRPAQVSPCRRAAPWPARSRRPSPPGKEAAGRGGDAPAQDQKSTAESCRQSLGRIFLLNAPADHSLPGGLRGHCGPGRGFLSFLSFSTLDSTPSWSSSSSTSPAWTRCPFSATTRSTSMPPGRVMGRSPWASMLPPGPEDRGRRTGKHRGEHRRSAERPGEGPVCRGSAAWGGASLGKRPGGP